MNLTQSIAAIPTSKNAATIGLAVLIVMLATLWFDLSFPLGVAGGVPYVIAIVLAWRTRSKTFVFTTSILSTIFVIMGYLFSQKANTDDSVIIINRLMALTVIWVTSALILRIINKHYQLKQSKESLSEHVEELKQLTSELQAQTDQLAASQNRYKMTIENSPIGIALIGPRGEYLNVNAALVEMIGYSRKELLKTNSQTLTHPDDLTEDIKLSQQLLDGSIKKYELNKRYLHKNGSEVCTQINVSLIKSETGEPLYFINQMQDITQRIKAENKIKNFNKKLEKEVKQRTKAAEKASKLYKDLYHNSPDMYASVSTETKHVVECNETFLKTIGYEREEIIGQEYYKIYHPDSTDKRKEALDTFLTYGNVKNAELALRHKSGKKIHVLLNVTALRNENGKIIESRSCWQDITERKKIEQQVHDLNEELEKRIENLDMVNQELESFSYSVSHDLRSPLRTIHGFCQALKEDYLPELPDQAKNYIDRVTAASIRMGQLIDDILALSRITRKEFVLGVVDITSLSEEVGHDIADQSNREVTFNIQAGMKSEGDLGLLRIVFENLIGNAVKYARSNVPLTIEVGMKNNKGNSTVIFVKDNGVGFDMQYADKLFSAFQRLHSDKEFEGTGIGLATVNRIVNRHNGKIWAESKVDHGSTFYFTLNP